MKHKFLIFSLLLFSGFILLNTSPVQAGFFGNDRSDLIKRISDKFKIKENEVQKVFDNFQNERRSFMEKKFNDNLNQAVKDGKITEAQKQIILKKHEELQKKNSSKPTDWKNITPEQRRQYKDSQRQELETWAKANNIDLKYFFGSFGPKRGSWQNK